MFINFSDLPGQQNLFLDYLYEFENVQNFYKKNFRDTTFYKQQIENLRKKAIRIEKDYPKLLSFSTRHLHLQNRLFQISLP